MRLKSIKFLIIFLLGVFLATFFAKQAYAGSYISGHVFVTYQGTKVYLKGANLEWKIITPGGGECSSYLNSYREVKSGDIYSYLFKGSNYPARLDCTTQEMGYGNYGRACKVNREGLTIDNYNNINYVFPRKQCFGCLRQKATLKPSFPVGYQGLPEGLSPTAGKWKLVLAESYTGATTFSWDEVLQMLTINDLNDVSEFIGIDFEWQAEPVTPTPTPTATPLPSATPTPLPPACCSCLLLASDHPDLARVKKGELLNFTAEAYVTTPETAKVLDMVFVLNHKGLEVANSGPIPAAYNRSEEIEGTNSDIYRSAWSWSVPNNTQAEGLYYLNLIIHCGWKEGAAQLLGESAGSQTRSQTGLRLLFGKIFSFLTGATGPTPTPTIPPRVVSPTIFRPSGAQSLQLGTFRPAPTLPASGCIDLYFQVLGPEYF